MGRNSLYGIEPHSFDELKRMVLQDRHKIASLQNRLASMAVRRHQTVYGGPSQTIAIVKNTSATDRGQFEILGLPATSYLSAPDFTLPLDGTTPTTASHTGRFCVTQEPIAAGNKGRCCVAGVTQCKLSITTAADKWAEVTNNNGSYLTTSSSSGSAQVLYPASGTGQTTGIVRLGTLAADEIIQLNHATATAGDIVEANASGVHPARIKVWNGSGYTNSTAVWLLLTDYYDVDTGAVIGEHGKFYGPAKLAGTMTVSSDTRPLYIAHVGDQTFVGKPDANIAKGASGTVSLWHRATEADSTINKTCEALGAAVTSGKYVTVQRINGQWYVGCWET